MIRRDKLKAPDANTIKTVAIQALLNTFLSGFEPLAFRLGARLFAVVPCRSVSVFATGYGTFLRVRVDTGRYLSLSVSPFRRPFISSILVFSKNGKWADVAYKSLLAAFRASIPCRTDIRKSLSSTEREEECAALISGLFSPDFTGSRCLFGAPQYEADKSCPA